MLSARERILREEAESERRFADALSFALRLTTAERRRLFAKLATLVEQEDEGPAQPAAPDLSAPANDPPPAPLMGDRAEAFVLASERGATPAVIGEAIGTNGRGVDQALREVARKRGTVERAGGKWYRAGKAPEGRLPLGLAIRRVLESGDAISTADIHERVAKLVPEAKKGSVATEINRLVDDEVVEVRGKAPHSKGYLYVLAKGGPAAAAAQA